jgi:predicted porin
MNRKVLVAAVAAAFVAPAAFAQSSVTIGGTVNIIYDTAKAGGATNNGGAAATGNNDLKSADRVRDGAGSNIRFSVIEDLGGGTSAFAQVESAVIVNSDQRGNAVGTAGASSGTAVWGTRNSGVGIRSKTAGRFLIGVWDVHYHESYTYDPGWIPGNSAQSTLGLTNSFGGTAGVAAIGGRYSNVIRWDSPVWSGFSINAAYARPSDGAPVNDNGTTVLNGKKNRAWNFAPQYVNGGLSINYSYLQDKDINQAAASTTLWSGATPAAGGVLLGVSTVYKVTSNRLGARYKFANGLGVGGLYDWSKFNVQASAAGVGTAGSSIKRHVWALMGTYDTGNHHIQATYARANDWSGNLTGTDVNSINLTVPNNGNLVNVGGQTGASMWTLGYQYNLSQRTNVSVSYAQIRNEQLARYDFFANSSGLGAGGYGADPKTLGVGLRHTW